MNSDLLPDIFNVGEPLLSDGLLSHLPKDTLIINDTAASSSGLSSKSRPGAVVSKIENIFEKVTGCILDEKQRVSIKFRTRGKASMTAKDPITGIVKTLAKDETKTVHFPSKSSKEAWKFSESLKTLKTTLTH